MARNLEFNQQQAIAAAIECFWQKGYAATSLKDLLNAMQISRSSFYNSFGDKRQMFDLCLEQYGNKTKSLCQAVMMSNAKTPWHGIEQFFSLVFLQITEEIKRKGCLLVNTLAETAEVDDQLKQKSLSEMAAVKECWHQALLADRAFSGLAESEQQQILEQLFSLLLGWRLQSQAGLSKQMLELQIKNSLEQIQLSLR